MQQTRTYRQRSRGFLAKAREELDAGDLEQASEKTWGAAALIVKAVAEARGLPHEKHSHLCGVVHSLARQNRDRELRWLFHLANGLHVNFYENTFDSQAVDEAIEDVELFVSKVDRLI